MQASKFQPFPVLFINIFVQREYFWCFQIFRVVDNFFLDRGHLAKFLIINQDSR